MTNIREKVSSSVILEAVIHFSVINVDLNLKPKGRLPVEVCLHVSFKFRR